MNAINQVRELRTSEKEHGSIYNDKLDVFVDKSINSLINTLNDDYNDNIIPSTTYCCSGLLSEHFNISDLADFITNHELEPYQYKFVGDAYITFEPEYHSHSDSGQLIVDPDYFEFKRLLEQTFTIAIFNNNFTEKVYERFLYLDLDHEIQEENTSRDYRLNVGYPIQYQELFAELDAHPINTQIELCDSILETVYNLLELRVKYSGVIETCAIMLDNDTQNIKIQTYPIHHLSDQLVSQIQDSNLTVNKVFDGYEISGTVTELESQYCKPAMEEKDTIVTE